MTLRFDATFFLYFTCFGSYCSLFVSALCYRQKASGGDTRSEASGDPSVFNKALYRR